MRILIACIPVILSFGLMAASTSCSSSSSDAGAGGTAGGTTAGTSGAGGDTTAGTGGTGGTGGGDCVFDSADCQGCLGDMTAGCGDKAMACDADCQTGADALDTCMCGSSMTGAQCLATFGAADTSASDFSMCISTTCKTQCGL